MDIIISTIAAEGIPSWVLHHALQATGFYGGARYTTALSALGPGGMLGGMISLAVIQAISFLLSETAIERIYICVIRELYKEGISQEEILDTIDGYHISRGLKERLKEEVMFHVQVKPQ